MLRPQRDEAAVRSPARSGTRSAEEITDEDVPG